MAICSGLVDLQPAGEGIAKLIPQVGDLVGRHWIGTGLQQRLECVSINSKSTLLNSCFSTTVTPHKATSVSPNGIAVKPYAKAPAAWRYSPRSLRLVGKMVNSVTPVTHQRCGSNYPAPSSRNGQLNAEGNSHAQDQRLRRCCCIVPDWRWSMDWRRNMDFDQCACWFEHRSILDDGECKEPRTTSIEPPVAKQALKKPRAMCLGLYFSVH